MNGYDLYLLTERNGSRRCSVEKIKNLKIVFKNFAKFTVKDMSRSLASGS